MPKFNVLSFTVTWKLQYATIIFLLILFSSCSNKPKHDPPNILFIMSDDHASNAIGAYGSRFSSLNPTPNLDRLAKEGILFENMFSTNSICSPSRASIITGQYSHINGVQDSLWCAARI